MSPSIDKEEKRKQKGKEQAKPEIEKGKLQLLQKGLEAIEGAKLYNNVDVEDLSLVLDLVLPPEFKMPKFEKYKVLHH